MRSDARHGLFVAVAAGVAGVTIGLPSGVRAAEPPSMTLRMRAPAPAVAPRPRTVPPPDQYLDVDIVPRPTDARRPGPREQLTVVGRFMLPPPPVSPVTRKSAVADENWVSVAPAQSYFFRYEPAYQFSTDFHGVTIGAR